MPRHCVKSLLTLLVILTLTTAAHAQTVLRTQILGSVSCAEGETFTVRLHLDTNRSDIRSFATQFTWYANLYELIDVEEAPGFGGDFEETSSVAGPVGSVGIAVTSTQIFSGLPAGAVLDFTFRTRTALITEQPFLLPPVSNPLFLTTGFSTFTGAVNFAATDEVTCAGVINPGDQYGILRTRLGGDVPCEIGQQFTLEIRMETNIADLESVITGFRYDANRYEFVSVSNGPAFTGIVDGTGNETGSTGTFALLLDGDDDLDAFSNGVVAIARFEVREANLQDANFTLMPDIVGTETRFFIADDDFFGSLVLGETERISCSSVPIEVEADTWAIR